MRAVDGNESVQSFISNYLRFSKGILSIISEFIWYVLWHSLLYYRWLHLRSQSDGQCKVHAWGIARDWGKTSKFLGLFSCAYSSKGIFEVAFVEEFLRFRPPSEYEGVSQAPPTTVTSGVILSRVSYISLVFPSNYSKIIHLPSGSGCENTIRRHPIINSNFQLIHFSLIPHR